MQMNLQGISSISRQHAPTASESKEEVDKVQQQEMRDAAKRFEASFIAQMLNHSGFGKALVSDGGKGAEAFSSLYVEQFAEEISQNGGFGLAERIYQQLVAYETAPKGAIK